MTAGSELLEALPVAVYTTDAEGYITYYNSAAAELWGRRPLVGSDQWCGSRRLFWPDGSPLAHDQCPMAVTLREGRPIRGAEAIAERPDGTRVHFLPFPTPLRDASGKLTGAINLLMDITARREADIESARLAAIVECSDDAIVSKTLDGTVTSWNAGAARIFGYEANEMLGQPITRIVPAELHGEESEVLARLRQGKRIQHYETVRVAKDGRRVDISLSVSPLRDRAGRVVGASKVARDITQRKQAETLQRLLIEELNHRVKNTLATVQAIAGQSLLRAKSPDEFVAGFSGRIQVLARAHTLLTAGKWQGADVRELVRDQVMLGPDDDHRISYSGPVLTLDPQTAMHLVLVVHELGTNARKHGALSGPDGRLAVSWELRSNGGRDFILEWKESGGPKADGPAKRGFGTTLIEQTLHACDGEADFRYGVDGMSCRLEFPLSQAAGPGPEGQAVSGAAESAASSAEQPAERSDLKGKRILIVEDEVLLSMDIETTLAEAGYDVAGPAGTLKKAMQLVTGGNCDAALVDANLGGHPVDELVALMTRNNIPFAFVTGYGRDALPLGFREALMLGKPFSREQLLGTVRDLLEQPEGVVRLRQKTA